MSDDLVKRLRTWADRHEADMLDMSASLEREAADRIEALEAALRGCLAVIRRDYYDQRAAALEGHIIAYDARKEWDQGWAALCEQPPEAP